MKSLGRKTMIIGLTPTMLLHHPGLRERLRLPSERAGSFTPSAHSSLSTSLSRIFQTIWGPAHKIRIRGSTRAQSSLKERQNHQPRSQNVLQHHPRQKNTITMDPSNSTSWLHRYIPLRDWAVNMNPIKTFCLLLRT